MINTEQHQNRMIENYFALIENLSDEDKIELIARISYSNKTFACHLIFKLVRAWKNGHWESLKEWVAGSQ